MVVCLSDMRVNILKLSNDHHHAILGLFFFNAVCSIYASLTVYAVSMLP